MRGPGQSGSTNFSWQIWNYWITSVRRTSREIDLKTKGGAVMVYAWALVAPLAAQWLNYPTPGIPRLPDGKVNLSAPAPKTADGRPDLTGLWEPFVPGSVPGAFGAAADPQFRDIAVNVKG